MSLIKMSSVREQAPIILNLVKDSGWCYAWGLVSVITIVPVLSFQVYEVWKQRKEGTHKVMQNLMATMALVANGSWMVSDLFFHDRFRVVSRWIFAISFIFLGLYAIFAFLQTKKESKQEVKTRRIMMVSKQTGGLMFVHTRQPLHRRPGRRVLARPKFSA